MLAALLPIWVARRPWVCPATELEGLLAATETMSRHARFADLVAHHPFLPAGTTVSVTEWAGCDEPWSDPIYVTAEAPGRELFDALCDLDADGEDAQVAFIVEQLLHG